MCCKFKSNSDTHCYSDLLISFAQWYHRGLEQWLCEMELFIKKFLHWSNKSIPYIKMFICICNLKIIPYKLFSHCITFLKITT